jgi:hypothetical protein
MNMKAGAAYLAIGGVAVGGWAIYLLLTALNDTDGTRGTVGWAGVAVATVLLIWATSTYLAARREQ